MFSGHFTVSLQPFCLAISSPVIYPGTYPLNLETVFAGSPLKTIVAGPLRGRECTERELKGEGREQRTKPKRGGSQGWVSQELAEHGQHSDCSSERNGKDDVTVLHVWRVGQVAPGEMVLATCRGATLQRHCQLGTQGCRQRPRGR